MKAKSARLSDKLLSIFISHMVQMKGLQEEKKRWKNLFFISHMVQMKVWISDSM